MCLKKVLKNYPIDHNTITLSSICIQTLSYLKKTRQTQIYPINPKKKKKNRNTHEQYLQLPKKGFFFFLVSCIHITTSPTIKREQKSSTFIRQLCLMGLC